MDLKKTFGKNLKRFRESKRMTQERFAEICGISTNHVSVVERGMNFPSAAMIEVFSQVLDVPPYMFFLPEKIDGSHETPFANSPPRFSLSPRQRKKILAEIGDILEKY